MDGSTSSKGSKRSQSAELSDDNDDDDNDSDDAIDDDNDSDDAIGDDKNDGRARSDSKDSWLGDKTPAEGLVDTSNKESQITLGGGGSSVSSDMQQGERSSDNLIGRQPSVVKV